MPDSPIEVFYSYAHEDESLRAELEKHLTLLRRQGLIAGWHDRQILAGTDWSQAIDTHLEQASVILLLISADFMASDYCFGIEMQRALERHEAKQARIIPILLRPVDWQGAPFAHLQVLPTNAKPVTSWNNQDEALTDIAAGLRRVIESLRKPAVSTPADSSLRPVWNLPYLRNPFFTDRDKTLQLLHENYMANRVPMKTRQVQAVSGLGGIGKTQVAVEYAYRYHHEYTFALWARAATRDTLLADFITIANLLQLPQKDERDQHAIVEAVKLWLFTHTGWLLILDNADDPELVRHFSPDRGNGHILLTTQRQTLGGLAKRIEVETMTPEEGALFLLRRANIDKPDDSQRSQALVISALLGGLPLALDQAGAYIEETGCGLADYIHLYNTHRAALLRERGSFATDHPESVATTWSLSFEILSKGSPEAVELLRFLAFLDPDAIPEEIITEGAPELGTLLEPLANNLFNLNAVIRDLLKYSLVRRDPVMKTLFIHRLLQAVLKDELDEAAQRLWAERAVRAVNRAFPEVEFATWQRCQRYLPHAQACTILIDQWKFTFPEAARLLHHTGLYLYERGQYTESEPLLQQALSLREQILEPQHPDIATSLSDLASLYRAQGKFGEVEQLYQKALALREQVLEPQHGEIAHSLADLAFLYYDQGKYNQAQPLLERSLAIREQALGPQHPAVAATLDGLALLYATQKKYEQAEPLYRRALAIREQILDLRHPDIATNLNNLAGLYIHQNKYDLAIPLLERALAIREETLGPEHPRVANSLSNLASLYLRQENDTQAEPLLQRSLHIREHVLGPEHPDAAITLRNLARLYRARKQYTQAAEFYQRALSIQEATLGSHHPSAIQNLKDLAELYREQGELSRAEQLYQRALAMSEQEPGSPNPDLISMLESYAALLQEDKRVEEAERVLQRVQQLRNAES